MQITFPTAHDNPVDCQLIVCITGSPASIAIRLAEIRNQIDPGYGKYDKPIQGTIINPDSVSSVITPVWKGKDY